MKDTKLHRFYSTFSVEEAKEWLTFVQSPYFNTNPNVVKMAKILRSYHPDMDHKGLDKQRVYKRIFGKEAYQDIKMRKLMSACVKLVERYWVNKEMEGNDLLYRRQLSHGYRHRDLFVDYQKEMNALIKDHEKRAKINPESFYDLYQLNWDLTADRQFLKGVEVFAQLEKATDNLSLHLDYQLLLNYIVWLDINKVSGVPIPKSIEAKFDSLNLNNIPDSHRILLLILDVIRDEIFNLDKYNNTKDYLLKYISTINQDVRYYAFRLLLNYLKRHQRKGVSVEELYIILLQESVNKGAMLYRNKMSLAIYINLTIALSQNKLIEQAYNFVDNHKAYLSGRQIDHTISLANTYVLFHQNKYTEAFELSSTFYFSGRSEFEIPRRTVQLKAAAASKNIQVDGVNNIADSYEKFLRRINNISIGKKNSLLKAIGLLRRYKSIQDHSYPNVIQRNKLISDIKASQTLNKHFTTWLIEQME